MRGGKARNLIVGSVIWCGRKSYTASPMQLNLTTKMFIVRSVNAGEKNKIVIAMCQADSVP